MDDDVARKSNVCYDCDAKVPEVRAPIDFVVMQQTLRFRQLALVDFVLVAFFVVLSKVLLAIGRELCRLCFVSGPLEV